MKRTDIPKCFAIVGTSKFINGWAENVTDEYIEMKSDYPSDGKQYIATDAGEWAVDQYKLIESVKSERDSLLQSAQNRVDRYRNQFDLNIETTDSPEMIATILQYMEDLRNIPEQDGFPLHIVWPSL